jgi:hypothetical protein
MTHYTTHPILLVVYKAEKGHEDKFKVDNGKKYSTYALNSALYKIDCFIHTLLQSVILLKTERHVP